jgi:hypothetical protein
METLLGAFLCVCCYQVLLEEREPGTPGNPAPQNECVYDEQGNLVDKSHPYAGCRGTPNEYDSQSDPVNHFIIDSGGPLRSGLPAAWDSMRHALGL